MSKISAKTSINTLPRLFKKVEWLPGNNLDLGGGKYQTTTNYLKSFNVNNFIYDPYNRTPIENITALRLATINGYDTVTISNVLCVIEEYKERIELLQLALACCKPKGKIYITVYEGDKSGISKTYKGGTWQANRKLETYFDEICEVFPTYEVKDKIVII